MERHFVRIMNSILLWKKPVKLLRLKSRDQRCFYPDFVNKIFTIWNLNNDWHSAVSTLLANISGTINWLVRSQHKSKQTFLRKHFLVTSHLSPDYISSGRGWPVLYWISDQYRWSWADIGIKTRTGNNFQLLPTVGLIWSDWDWLVIDMEIWT